MTRFQQILQSKAAYRRQLARRPVAEKLRIVEQLAERTRAIRQDRAKRNSTNGSRP
jgi:hypothetical protein